MKIINIIPQIKKSEKIFINKNNLRNVEAFYVNKAFIKKVIYMLKNVKNYSIKKRKLNIFEKVCIN